MLKLYPSSSGFCWGNLVISEYGSGCIRKILLSANGYRTEIAETSKETGAKWEEQVLEQLINDQEYAFHREVPFRYEVNGVTVSGRCDYFVYDDAGGCVIECKGSNSKSVLYDVINKGKVKINHLAQLVHYLNYFGTDHGKIMVSFVETQKQRTFIVTVEGDGQIYVDGKFSGYTAHDQVKHTLNASEAIRDSIVWERPTSFNGDPCKFCEFKPLCTDWDTGEITDSKEFIDRGVNWDSNQD
jgi:hypothetical protein